MTSSLDKTHNKTHPSNPFNQELKRSPYPTMANFSATCSRFSQFLKDQQRLAATVRPTTTMSLLPGLNVLPEPEDDTNISVPDRQAMDLFPRHAGLRADAPMAEKDKLMIFYGGEMLVFEDFPVEKAKDLMTMAGKVDTSASPPPSSNLPAVTGRGMRVLPMSRRASLHRFMEKRRERIHSSKAPYRVGGSRVMAEADSTKKPISSLPWFLTSSQQASNVESFT